MTVNATSSTQSTIAKAECDISVAVLYPGNRVDKMLDPLKRTEMNVSVEPADAYSRDICLIDNADRDLIKPVCRKVVANAKVIYRMRGDLYRELETWGMHPVKKWVATKLVVGNVDGVLAVNQILADKARDRSNVQSTGVAAVSIEASNWTDTEHIDNELRLVTLTNADYVRKVEPILEWAPVVEAHLSKTRGEWRIGGDGQHANLIRQGVDGFDHVNYCGYLSAYDSLDWANAMLHPSRLDGVPNSILEGMASRLPVLTNGFEAFVEFGGPLRIATRLDELEWYLDTFTSPLYRDELGQRCLEHVESHYSHEAVGKQYVDYFMQVVGGQ